MAQPVRDLGLKSATDPEIYFAAREAGAVVITKDQDFVRLLERHGPPPQVIWVTCGNTSNERMRAVFSASFHSARMEFFSWRTFRNTKEVGSLAGLTPTPKDGGKRYREQGVGKDGSQHIRGSAIELARGWLRFQPESELAKW